MFIIFSLTQIISNFIGLVVGKSRTLVLKLGEDGAMHPKFWGFNIAGTKSGCVDPELPLSIHLQMFSPQRSSNIYMHSEHKAQ